MKKKKKKKKVRFKYKNILIFLGIITVLYSTGYYFAHLKITNIFIRGNTLFTDQEIIRIAKLEDYPETLSNSSRTLEKRLSKEMFIDKVDVKKKSLTQVYIEIKENYPLYIVDKKTVLFNGETTNELLDCPIVINKIPNELNFKKYFTKIDRSMISRISEIKYEPDKVDDELFRFTMSDGNYAYVTLKKIEKINKYVDLIKEFDKINGTLYLNSGEYFKVN